MEETALKEGKIRRSDAIANLEKRFNALRAFGAHYLTLFLFPQHLRSPIIVVLSVSYTLYLSPP